MISVLIFWCLWWSSQIPDDKEIGYSNVLILYSSCSKRNGRTSEIIRMQINILTNRCQIWLCSKTKKNWSNVEPKKGIYSEMCQCCWRRFWRCTFAHFEICHKDGCAIVRHRQWTCRPTIFVDVSTTIYSDTPESGAELESAAPESGAQPLFLLMHQQPIFCEQLQLGTRKLHDPKMQNTTFNKA